MDYKVRFIDDEQMPEGHTWAICAKDGQTTLLLRRSSMQLSEAEKCAALEAAWAGYRDLLLAR